MVLVHGSDVANICPRLQALLDFQKVGISHRIKQFFVEFMMGHAPTVTADSLGLLLRKIIEVDFLGYRAFGILEKNDPTQLKPLQCMRLNAPEGRPNLVALLIQPYEV
jgi:hypothetical protein